MTPTGLPWLLTGNVGRQVGKSLLCSGTVSKTQNKKNKISPLIQLKMYSVKILPYISAY